MSKTHRNLPHHRMLLRKPKTKNEKSKLDMLIHDPDLTFIPISGMNRIKSRAGRNGVPTSWEDILASSYYQIYKYD